MFSKNLIRSVTFIAILTVAACDSDTNSQVAREDAREEFVEHALKHTDPSYFCPMHPAVVRDQPGTCPICGANLVPVEIAAADETASKIQYYRHPMNPTVTSAVPMKDEMGMDYVAIYDDGAGSRVRISAAVVNNLGVRTAAAEKGPLWKRIDTVGYVQYDESQVWHIHARAEGWIEGLRIDSVGERVSEGQPLFGLYAPALATAQEEYLKALGRGNQALIVASETRLRSLGIPAASIESLRRTRKPDANIRFTATTDAVVTQLDVRDGMFVAPATNVMTLANLSSVWVVAEVFQRQADWIGVGRPAEVRLSSQPGRVWEGEVEFIYPVLDPKTRTLQVRMRFDNPDEELKPNMFAKITLFGGPTADVVHIPKEALIRTARNDRVILDAGAGRFQPREVVAGLESGDRVEIKAGLEAGDVVVTSGQFLIDSEASLKASFARLRSGDDKSPAGQ